MATLTDKEMEIEIGLMLLHRGRRIGGYRLSWRHTVPDQRAQLRDYARRTAERGRPLVASSRGVARFDAASVIQLGISAVIATPVVRVGSGVAGFARQRDRLYVAVSALVLAILIYGLTKLREPLEADPRGLAYCQ